MATSANMRGAVFMALSMAGFVFNDAVIKSLSQEIAIGQIMFVRGLAGTIMILIFTYMSGALRSPRVAASPFVALRIFGEVLGTITFLTGLTYISIGNASAILQALPLAVTMGAALFLKEPVGWRRWSAILVGFAGVMIIVRPGLDGFTVYSLMILGTVFFAAVRDIATKLVPKDVPSLYLTTLTSLAVTLTGAAMIIPQGGWQPMSVAQIGECVFAAGLLLVGYQFIIVAMRTGEVSFIAPFRYTSLLWAILLGYIIFAEIPDLPMVVGASLIISSGLYTLYRERKVARSQPAQDSSTRHFP